MWREKLRWKRWNFGHVFDDDETDGRNFDHVHCRLYTYLGSILHTPFYKSELDTGFPPSRVHRTSSSIALFWWLATAILRRNLFAKGQSGA